MKKFFLLLVLCVICSCVYSNDFIKLSEGKYVLAISVDAFDINKPAWKDMKHIGDTDGALIVFDKDKNIIDKITFGGEGEECVQNIIEAYDGIYVLGTVWEDSFGTGDFKNLKSQGKRDWFIAKFTKDFQLEKIVSFGTKHYDFAEDIVVCDSGFAVVGRTYQDSDNMEIAFISLIDKDLNLIKTQLFRSSNKKPNDVLLTSFESVIVNDKGNFVCVGDASVSDFIDVPSYGIIVEFDKNLKIVNKKSVKNSNLSVCLNGIVQNNYYLVSGYIVKNEVSNSYFVAFDKNLNQVKSELFVPKSDDKEYPVHCSFEKIFANPYIICGFAGKYKGNGDYDDDFYHMYAIPCSEKGLNLTKKVQLPKDTYTYLVDNNKISALIFSREKGEEFRIVDKNL